MSKKNEISKVVIKTNFDDSAQGLKVYENYKNLPDDIGQTGGYIQTNYNLYDVIVNDGSDIYKQLEKCSLKLDSIGNLAFKSELADELSSAVSKNFKKVVSRN